MKARIRQNKESKKRHKSAIIENIAAQLCRFVPFAYPFPFSKQLISKEWGNASTFFITCYGYDFSDSWCVSWPKLVRGRSRSTDRSLQI
jgi:hypothetical protein